MTSDAQVTALFAADESRDQFDLDPLACPGVFYPTLAADGVLSRIRTPGGLLTARQCRLLAAIAASYAGGRAAITNRANVQLRALTERLPDVVLREMQREGLASNEPRTDHLRNVMASPLAGLDPAELLDVRPLIAATTAHLEAHPELTALPAKFSVGLDGGERATIAGFPNDILLRAVPSAAGVRLRVILRAGEDDDPRIDLGLSVQTNDALPVLAAIAEWYLSALPTDGGMRLRALLDDAGIAALRDTITARVTGIDIESAVTPVELMPVSTPPVGVHAQADGRVAMAIPPRLGGWSSAQLRAVAAISERHGSSSLRLSPWRTVLIPDIDAEHIEAALAVLETAGLPAREPSLAHGIVACAGIAGCAASGTDTGADATALAAALQQRQGTAVSVHFSGCPKGCAQRRQADVTLVGDSDRPGMYDLYVRDLEATERFGRRLHTAVAASDVIALCEQVLA